MKVLLVQSKQIEMKNNNKSQFCSALTMIWLLGTLYSISWCWSGGNENEEQNRVI